MNRRGFLGTVAGSAFAFQVVPRHVLGRGFVPPSEKLDIAGIGIGGRGGASSRRWRARTSSPSATSTRSRPGRTFETYAKAERFVDYRVLLDKCKASTR